MPETVPVDPLGLFFFAFAGILFIVLLLILTAIAFLATWWVAQRWFGYQRRAAAFWGIIGAIGFFFGFIWGWIIVVILMWLFKNYGGRFGVR